MQIFELYSDIETPILTMWIGCLPSLESNFVKECLETPYCTLRESALADERFIESF